MRLAFRVDASQTIGAGHVSRCLALADHMREAGHESHFFCKDHPGNLREEIVARGHPATMINVDPRSLPLRSLTDYSSWVGGTWEDDVAQTKRALSKYAPNWIIVDHYGLDARWEREIGTSCQVMVIDDLANRKHLCRMLVDQNIGRMGSDYDDLVSQDSRKLIGPRYALLGREFSEKREISLLRRRSSRVKKILISFGGVDQANASELTLLSLAHCMLPDDIQIVVALGSASPWRDRVVRCASEAPFPCDVVVGSASIASLMAESDVSIGAGGGMALERCCMGLPTILVVLADNQAEGSQALARLGAALGPIYPDEIAPRLCSLLSELQVADTLQSCIRQASGVTDGKGCARVAEQLSAVGAVDA